jgi:hypothetical protein
VDENFVKNTNNATQNFCVTPITAYADNALMDVFTTVRFIVAYPMFLYSLPLDIWFHGCHNLSLPRFSLRYKEGAFRLLALCYVLFLKHVFQRLEDERFKKIDAKRGGRGFV